MDLWNLWMYISLERTFRGTQWHADAAGGGVRRCMGSARRSGRVLRVASLGRASDDLLLGLARLNTPRGAVPLGLATQVSRWTRPVALCRWELRESVAHLAERG